MGRYTPVSVRLPAVEIVTGTGARDRIDVDLTWRAVDPFAVQVLTLGPVPVQWWVDRALLRAGLDGPAGVRGGDVSVMPDLSGPGRVELVLHLQGAPVQASAALLLPIVEVAGFLAETLTVVPFGRETYVMDMRELGGVNDGMA